MEKPKLRIYGIKVTKRQFLIAEGIFLFLFTGMIIFLVVRYYSDKSMDPGQLRKTRLTIYFFVLMIIWIIMEAQFFLNRFTKAQMGIITRQRNQLEMQKQEILDSIRYASRIQSAILPSEKIIRNEFPDSFLIYLPKDIVAGDFYWINRQAGKTFFTAADCTGHGVPGAMISVMCSNALTRSVKELSIYKPSEILDKTIELLEENFASGEEEVKDGMDLALCSFDTKSRILEYAGANNPLYYIRDNELFEIKPDKQSVGNRSGRHPYTNHSLEIKRGDTIYLFSDGYPDQFGGPAGKKFKYKQFREVLLSNYKKAMDEQKQILEHTLESWQGDLEQVDDICILGIRF